MPTAEAHLAIARKNQLLIERLRPAMAEHSAWVATVAFYKALHIVEAVFFHDAEIRHTSDHGVRNSHLRKIRRYAKVWSHYGPLYRTSLIARYLAEERGPAYETFGDYMTPEQVEREALNHHLRQIEQSAARLVSTQLPDLVERVHPAAPVEPPAKT
jgi:hypothetical protein